MVEEAVQNVGIVASATAAAGLVARYGIKRSSKVVENGIDTVSERAENSIERFFEHRSARHETELADRRVVTSRVHEERASVVIELYRRIVQFERDVRAVTTGASGDRSPDELHRTAVTSGNAVASYYEDHRIYFPAETCDVIESVQQELHRVFHDVQARGSNGRGPEGRSDDEARMNTVSHVTEDEIPDRTRELESHFRDLLGIDEE